MGSVVLFFLPRSVGNDVARAALDLQVDLADVFADHAQEQRLHAYVRDNSSFLWEDY